MATLFTASQTASRLPASCFVLGSITALIGVGLGIYLGISHDHTLAPAHVHHNLIGWVSMFLFGLFYKAHPSATGKVAAAQVLLVAIGYIAMLSGLAGLLIIAHPFFQPLTIAGSLSVLTGFALFTFIVMRVGQTRIAN